MKRQRIEVMIADGEIAWLERLTPRQMISIGDRLWSEQRKRLIDDLKDAEVDSADKIIALRDLDGRRGLMSEIVHHSIGLHGSLEIIAEAAKGVGAENSEGLPDNFAGTGEDAIKIALSLIGAELEESPAPGESKKKQKK